MFDLEIDALEPETFNRRRRNNSPIFCSVYSSPLQFATSHTPSKNEASQTNIMHNVKMYARSLLLFLVGIIGKSAQLRHTCFHLHFTTRIS